MSVRAALTFTGQLIEATWFPFASLVVPHHRGRLDALNAYLADWPNYSQGLLRPHHARLFGPEITACGLPTWRGTSSHREPTLIGVMCLRCAYERRRAVRLAARKDQP